MAAIAKCVLVVVNVIITIIGIVFLGGGLYVQFSGVAEEKVADVVEAIPDLPEKFNLQDSNQNLDQATLDLTKLISKASIGLCIAGAVLLLIGICGCCGVCCKSKKLLITYIVVVCIMIVVQVAVAVALYTGKFNKQIKSTLKKGIVSNFKAIDSLEADSILLNVIQLFFGCCGIDSISDYYEVANDWDRNRTIYVEEVDRNETVYLQTPFSCCKVQGDFPDVEPLDKQCAINATEANSNQNKGCFEEISAEANDYKIYIYAAAGGGVCAQLLMVIAAIVVCHSLHRQGTVDLRG